MKKSLWIVLLLVIACMFTLSACDEGNDPQTPTDDHAHAFGEWTTVKDSTCTVNGEQERSCSCGERETKKLDALGHDITEHKAQAPGCTTVGWDAYVTCSRCDYSTYAEISLLDHDMKVYDAKEPTCTVIGWDAYASCSRCDYSTYVQKPALKHDTIEHAAQDTTCTEIGWKAYETCSRCNYSTYKEISAPGHRAETWIIDKEPTKTENGKRHQVCFYCQTPFNEEILYATGSVGLSYRISGSNAIVTGIGSCSDTDIYIPKYYYGREVIAIGDRAFSECMSFTSITLPDSITNIGEAAFIDCARLSKIRIPDSVISIGKYAFGHCLCLESVIFDENIKLYEISDWVFYQCISLVEINIPDSVTTIGYHAFSHCSSLTNLDLPENLTAIGESAFEDCDELKNIVLPKNVSCIPKYSFCGCENLESITIPEGVTTIGDYAFYACSRLKNIRIPQSVTTIGGEVFSFTSIETIIIPEGITQLPDFYHCVNLKSITLPGSLIFIHSDALHNCYDLISINFSGTKAQWEAISKTKGWDQYLPKNYTVYCTDGTIQK